MTTEPLDPDDYPGVFDSPAPTTRRMVLDAASQAVMSRPVNYGQPEDSFSRIAQYWNLYLENSGAGRRLLSPADVSAMMILLKLVRLESNPAHLDSWVDIAGYAACGGEASDAR